MNNVTTLLEFLESSGSTVKIHDIGRRVCSISRDDFLKFEKQQLAYPYPVQQQAWFAISMTHEAVNKEAVIWFLRFPLDETGKLQAAGRDYFMHRLFEAAGAEHDALKDNPHVFKPREDIMAIYHARLSRQLKKPPSKFYQHASTYLQGDQGWEQWNFVGFQGIADFVARLDENNNEALLAKAIPHLPVQPLEAVCQCLENRDVSLALTEVLLARYQQESSINHPDSHVIASLCRAVALSVSHNRKNDLLNMALSGPAKNSPDVLAAISARNWEWLTTTEHAQVYLYQLADCDQESFNQCLLDLLYMPGLRDTLLSVIRNPERPNQLATRFGQMMQQIS